MKKIIFIFSLILISSCSTVETNEIDTEVLDKTIRIEISTLEASDAVQISYYDYVTDSDNFSQHIFEYDSSGKAIPVVITLEDYDFRYIRGEVYRKNSIPTQLSLRIYVDDELIIDESETGDGSKWVNIGFNYDIAKMSNI